jgi:hypothetical protein
MNGDGLWIRGAMRGLTFRRSGVSPRRSRLGHLPSPIGIIMTNVPTESNAVIESILSRRATKYYDPNATLSDDQIRELVRIGTSAPTSFHLQNWRFIAVRSPEAKARLRPIAWDQPATTSGGHLHCLRPVG